MLASDSNYVSEEKIGVASRCDERYPCNTAQDNRIHIQAFIHSQRAELASCIARGRCMQHGEHSVAIIATF